MIAASAMPPASTAAAARSPSAPRDGATAAATASADRPSAATNNEAAPVRTRGGHESDKASDSEPRASDFDSLLVDAGASATASAAPAPTGRPRAGLTGAVEPTNATVSPDGLLALLDGSWAQALPAAPPAPAAPVVSAALPVAADVAPPPAAAAAAAAAASALAKPDIGDAATDLAGRITETADNSLVREAGSSDPAPLTAATATAATATARSPAPVQAAPIALPADPDAGFDDAFGSRITWMAEQRLGHAEIRVTPDNAGPIDVRLQLDGTRVSADFQSSNPEVRQALEASMARLRDMLEQQGLQLAHAGVGNGHSERGAPDMRHGHDPDREAELDPRMGTGPILRSARGLLDEYA